MFGGHKRMVNSVAVSADDTFLVSGGEDTTLRVWHSTSGNCELVLEDHSDEVNCVAISKDMKVLLSGSKDKSVKIWERKTGKVIMTLFDHRQSVTCLAVSPTGPFFVSGSKDCTAVVWVLNPGGKGSTGDRMYIIPHQYPVHSVCFSFEGNVIFTGSGREPVKEEENNMEFLTSGEIGVFAADRREGEALLPPFSYFGGPVVSIAVSRAKNDGMGQKVAAASTADIYFIVLDMDTRETHRFQGHDSVVTSVDITEDGASVVSGSWDNSVRFWETKTCTCLKVLLGHSSNVNAVTLSGGGQKCFSAGEDEQIGVWDLMAVKELLSSDVLSDSINSVCMSADGSTVAALIGLKQVYLWSVTTGKHIYTIKSEHGVSCLGLSPSGDYVCLGLDIKEVHVWSSSVSGSGMGLFGDPSKSSGNPGLILTPKSTHTTTAAMGGNQPRLLHTLTGHTDVVTCVCCTDSLVLSGSADKTVRLYDLEEGLYSGITLSGHTGELTCIAVSPAPNNDFHTTITKEASMFDSFNNGSSAELLKLTAASSKKVSPSQSSRKNKNIDELSITTEFDDGNDNDKASGSDGEVPQSPIATSNAPGDSVVTIGTPTGKAFVSSKYMVTSSKKEKQSSPERAAEESGKPVKQFIVTGSEDSTARVWDMFGKEMRVLSKATSTEKGATTKSQNQNEDIHLAGHTAAIRSVCIDYSLPAAPRVLTGSDDDSVKIWNLQLTNDNGTAKVHTTLYGHQAEVRSVSISKDGKCIVSGGDDKTIKLWDGHEHFELLELRGHSGPVQLVQLDPSGNNLLTAAKDNTIKSWKIIARTKKRADLMHDYRTSIKEEVTIKKEAMTFRKRVMSNK